MGWFNVHFKSFIFNFNQVKVKKAVMLQKINFTF